MQNHTRFATLWAQQLAQVWQQFPFLKQKLIQTSNVIRKFTQFNSIFLLSLSVEISFLVRFFCFVCLGKVETTFRRKKQFTNFQFDTKVEYTIDFIVSYLAFSHIPFAGINLWIFRFFFVLALLSSVTKKPTICCRVSFKFANNFFFLLLHLLLLSMQCEMLSQIPSTRTFP